MAVTAAVVAVPVAAAPLDKRDLRRIADTYAGLAVEQGLAVSAGVAILYGGETHFYGYGNAAPKGDAGFQPVTPDTIYVIASNTKLFTTNLLGQFVAEGRLSLDDTLRRFRDRIGPLAVMAPLKRQITLGELGSFTAGLADSPDFCGTGQRPGRDGCLPYRPYFWSPTKAYGSRAFLSFLSKTPLQDWANDPPTAIDSLPAPYSYSNASIALIGLLLGTPPGQQISDRSVDGWFDLVSSRIIAPLGLRDTYLTVPAAARSRLAAGYERATASVDSIGAGGVIAGIRVVDGGQGYAAASPPRVTISGGGGSGATARAVVKGGAVTGIEIVRGGTGYVHAPVVTVKFEDGDEVMPPGSVGIRDGRITGISANGWWWPAAGQPTVEVAGGLGTGRTRPALVVARKMNDTFQFLEVVDGGAGYVEPLTVTIEPGAPTPTLVPIFAPAGFLKSSVRDMATFLRAAMGYTEIDGRPVPAALTAGFALATTPQKQACEYADQKPCRTFHVGLAWEVFVPGPGQPAVMLKDGALPGYSSQVMMAPKLGLGVVVLTSAADDNGLGDDIADAIFYDLYFRCTADRTACPPRSERP